jgi:glycosyltransferase involved in cell wall biosynthesis
VTGHTVSVVIPCHDERRWPSLYAAVASVAAQTLSPQRVVVVVDHNERLLHLARRGLAAAGPIGVTVLPNRQQRGVCGTRNTGVLATRTDLVAFLDSDIVAPPRWLESLVAPFTDPRVVGTGGAIRPVWTSRPTWVPDEFLWAFGGAYPGMPQRTAVVRNVWSASMVVRRTVFDEVGGFAVGFGKVGRRSRPEDTELCLAMSGARRGVWVYRPSARVAHHLPEHQSTFGYFLTRCFAEGRGKIALSRRYRGRHHRGRRPGRPAGGGTLHTERAYLLSLPRAAIARVADTVSGRDRHGLAKAGAIAAGVAAAGAGGVVELISGAGRAGTAPTTGPDRGQP